MTYELLDIHAKQPISLDEMIDRGRESKPERLSQEQLQAMAEIDRAAASDEELLVDIADITGVVSGVKPSSIMVNREEFDVLFAQLGLAVDRLPENNKVTIAWTQELASELAETFSQWLKSDDRGDAASRKIGKLLGYPETSTDYYIRRLAMLSQPVERQLPAIEPVAFEGSARKHFSQIILSADHWREETAAYVIPLENATKDLAPRSYEEFERMARKERVSIGLRRLVGKQLRSPFGDDSVAVKWVK